MLNDLQNLKDQREAVNEIVKAYDRIIELAEREAKGEHVTEEEENATLGYLFKAWATVQSLA